MDKAEAIPYYLINRTRPTRIYLSFSIIAWLSAKQIKMTIRPPTTSGNWMRSSSLHSVQNDNMAVPLPGMQVSCGPSTALHHVSDPPPADISIPEFSITSHDQGFCNDPTKCTWTWYEVSIIRPWCEEPGSDINNLKHNAGPKPNPEDFGVLFRRRVGILKIFQVWARRTAAQAP